MQIYNVRTVYTGQVVCQTRVTYVNITRLYLTFAVTWMVGTFVFNGVTHAHM